MAFYKCARIYVTENSNTAIYSVGPAAIANFTTVLSGKNILDPNSCALENYYEVNSNGTIKVLASNAKSWDTLPEIPIDAGTYTVSKTVAGGRLTVRTALSNYESNAVALLDGETSGTFTISSNTKMRMKIMTSYSSYPVDVGVMIEKGTTATTFEPYKIFKRGLALPLVSVKSAIVATQEAGTPTPQSPKAISGVSAVSVYHSGANLWNEQWELGAWSSVTGDAVNYQDRIRCKNAIPVVPNTSYCIRFGTTASSVVNAYDENGNFISNLTTGTFGTGGRVITTPSNCYYIKFSVGTAYGTTYNNDISVNYPSTDTDYHAYNPNSDVTLINLGGTYYGGYVEQDKDGKRELVNNFSELVNLNSLTWYPTVKQGNTCFYANLPNGIIKSGGEQLFNGFCESYKTTNDFNMSSDLTIVFYCSSLYGGYTRVLIRDNNASAMTGDEFKEYVTGKISYPINTPIELPLTDTPAIIAFNGVNNVWNDSGDTTIKYRNLAQGG